MRLLFAIGVAVVGGCGGQIGGPPPPPPACSSSTPTIVDLTKTIAHLSTGLGSAPPLIDAANRKLLIVATAATGLALYRCELDGSSCTYQEIVSGTTSIAPVGAQIDDAAGKLLVVGGAPANAYGRVYRCDLDGSACVYTDLSAAIGNVGDVVGSAIDPINSKLLILTTSGLVGCALDATDCTFSSIATNSTGAFQGPLVIDKTNHALLVVAAGQQGGPYAPVVVRCNLDGTGCGQSAIANGQSPSNGIVVSMVIDEINGKLLITADPSSLFRCNLDGSGCTYTDIGAYGYPVPLIDTIHDQLLVVTSSPALGRCNLDGSACTYRYLPAASGVGVSVVSPNDAAIDSVDGSIVVVEVGPWDKYSHTGYDINLVEVGLCW